MRQGNSTRGVLGKHDPRHHAFDGLNLLSLSSPSLPIVIPPMIYGLKGPQRSNRAYLR
jgi:hypothetical protein